MFVRYNDNPLGLEVGDCVIRAISTANLASDIAREACADRSAVSDAVDVKKGLFEIEEMEMGGDNQSGNSYRYGGSYRSGNSNRGYSRRGSNMSYRYDNGYSMDNDNSSYAHLEEAMKHASSEQEREAIRKLINQNYR